MTLSTAIELPEMPKRNLADRILDEIVALRRPKPLVLEFDEHVEDAARPVRLSQEQVLSESDVPTPSARRQLIVE